MYNPLHLPPSNVNSFRNYPTRKALSVSYWMEKHPDGLQINTLVVETNIPINRITGILFELEMKGVIRTLAGGMYRLL